MPKLCICLAPKAKEVDLPLRHLLLEVLGLRRVLRSHVLVALLQVRPVLHHLDITMIVVMMMIQYDDDDDDADDVSWQ